MITRTLVVAATLAAASGLARAQVDDTAKAKLQQMADTVKNAKSLSYKVQNFWLDGFMAGIMPTTNLEVSQVRAENGQWRSRAEGRRDAAGQGTAAVAAIEILTVSDGAKRAWLDHPNKIVFERPEGQTNNADVPTTVQLAMLREFVEPEPFTKEFAAPTMKMEPAQKYQGEECDIIVVDRGPNLESTKWVISQGDHLPRRVERTMGGGVGTQVWALSQVKVNPEVPAKAFILETPDGFTFNSNIAPTPPPQPPAPTPGTNTVAKPAGGSDAPPAKPHLARSVGTNVGDLAPDFELQTPKGETVKLSSLRGSVVVLDFWGTWCLNCKKANPEMQKLVEANKGKPVRVLGLSVRENPPDKPVAYMADNKYTWDALLQADKVATETYKIKEFPTYFVIGKEGEIVFASPYKTVDETFPALNAAVEAALTGQATAPAKAEKAAPSAKAAPGAGAADK